MITGFVVCTIKGPDTEGCQLPLSPWMTPLTCQMPVGMTFALEHLIPRGPPSQPWREL